MRASWSAAWHTKIGVRLLGAFGVLLALVGVALAVCAHAFTSIGRAERQVEAYEITRHAADRASILMREQYIHQAHTLIAFDDSHLDHYREVVAIATSAVSDLRAKLASPEDTALVDALEEHRAASDRTFQEKTVPAVLRGDRAEATRLHEEMERSVVEFSKTVRTLHDRNDARATAARAEVERAWSRARWASLACLVAALAFGIAMALMITKTVVARIAALRAGAERIGAGDLEHRIGLDARDELGDLARSFDSMAEGLTKHQDDLVRSQRLASMGQVAAGIAHELNNPLGVILGYAKLLRRRGEWDADALAAIEQEATLASETVATMLELTKSDNLKLVSFDLTTLLRESAARISQLERTAGVEVIVSSPDNLVVKADEVRVRQLIVNLLTNAAEAAAPSGRVEATAAAAGGATEIVVDDTGPGISEHERRRLFEPFHTTKPHGAGLGLSIVRRIVEAHHGSIVFERSPLGGARAVVRLPNEGTRGGGGP